MFGIIKLTIHTYGNRGQYCVVQIDGNDSNLLIVFYVQIMPDGFIQLHRF